MLLTRLKWATLSHAWKNEFGRPKVGDEHDNRRGAPEKHVCAQDEQAAALRATERAARAPAPKAPRHQRRRQNGQRNERRAGNDADAAEHDRDRSVRGERDERGRAERNVRAGTDAPERQGPWHEQQRA